MKREQKRTTKTTISSSNHDIADSNPAKSEDEKIAMYSTVSCMMKLFCLNMMMIFMSQYCHGIVKAFLAFSCVVVFVLHTLLSHSFDSRLFSKFTTTFSQTRTLERRYITFESYWNGKTKKYEDPIWYKRIGNFIPRVMREKTNTRETLKGISRLVCLLLIRVFE